MIRKLFAVLLAVLLIASAAATVWAYDYGYDYDYDYDSYDYEETDSQLTMSESIWISLGLGALIGIIVVLCLAAQLKSVRRKPGAGDYIRSGSMRLRASSDIFLYQNTTRIARPKNNKR